MKENPEQIVELLKEHNVRVTFRKKSDDSIRVLDASRWQDIPDYQEDLSAGEPLAPDLPVKVYELGVGWRSFYLDRVENFEIIP